VIFDKLTCVGGVDRTRSEKDIIVRKRRYMPKPRTRRRVAVGIKPGLTHVIQLPAKQEYV